MYDNLIPYLPDREKRNKIVILGGSGVNEMPQFEGKLWQNLYTEISDGNHDGFVKYQESGDLIFIKRHGVDTIFGPAVTNYKANLVAARLLGAKCVIATSACGSFYPPENDAQKVILEGSLVVPGDTIDNTGRNNNIFGTGFVVHAQPKPTPFYEELSDVLYKTACNLDDRFNGIHQGQVYISIPGDTFGTVAEGKMRKNMGADIVGMTIAQEAIIALQLDLPYAAVAFPVDYDLNANHVKKTLEWFNWYSEPQRIPDYLTAVVAGLADFTPLPQNDKLSGNIIPQRFDNLPKSLQYIAKELVEIYL